MKITIIILFLSIITFNMSAQSQNDEPKYTMQTYFFVFLKFGTYKAKDTAESHKITAGHMENISRLAKLGKLKLAGPFVDEGEYIGIFILDVATEEEAKEILDTDPAIKIGSFAYDMKKWYGPKGLTVIPDKKE